MIKEIIASTLLATTIGIQNTTITQNTTRVVYLNDTSYWTENNEDNGTYTNRSYYRTRQTTHPITTDAFTIKQRIIEFYYHGEENEHYYNEYYLLIYAQSNYAINQTQLNELNTIISGQINNYYQFNSGYYQTFYINTQITYQTILDFLDDEPINDATDYGNLLYDVNQNQDFQWNLPATALTNQDYGNIINNFNLPNLTNNPTQYIATGLKIRINYNEQTPIDPYSPFSNFGETINYQNIKFTSQVNSGGQGEIVDLPGMMLMILGMPFTFIAQAYNLTIFPGTMYEVNIAQIFLAIVGAGILLFVIKKFLK